MINIIEAESIEEMVKHISHADTLVVCDLDNTLIETTIHFGSVQWGEDFIRKLVLGGKSQAEAEEEVKYRWFSILPHIPMRLIETKTPKVLQDIHQKGIPVFGLTARFPEEVSYTLQRLRQFDLNFNKNYLNCELSLKHAARFEEGILFCGTKNRKSDALLHFLQQNDLQPRKIIFVDDKLHHLEDLANSLTRTPIEYVGIRFSGSDKRVKGFNAALATIQEKFFPQFISDVMAQEILENQCFSQEK